MQKNAKNLQKIAKKMHFFFFAKSKSQFLSKSFCAVISIPGPQGPPYEQPPYPVGNGEFSSQQAQIWTAKSFGGITTSPQGATPIFHVISPFSE